MTTGLPTELPGDKLRKAIDAFCELKKTHPSAPQGELIAKVSQKFDLSPRECDFLIRQLNSSCTA